MKDVLKTKWTTELQCYGCDAVGIYQHGLFARGIPPPGWDRVLVDYDYYWKCPACRELDNREALAMEIIDAYAREREREERAETVAQLEIKAAALISARRRQRANELDPESTRP